MGPFTSRPRPIPAPHYFCIAIFKGNAGFLQVIQNHFLKFLNRLQFFRRRVIPDNFSILLKYS